MTVPGGEILFMSASIRRGSIGTLLLVKLRNPSAKPRSPAASLKSRSKPPSARNLTCLEEEILRVRLDPHLDHVVPADLCRSISTWISRVGGML
jgi:hypothetical protein